MFDIGFPELVLIGIVALLVIGPDKLPETVRTVALWVGRIRRTFANIKAEIENEIGADEIRRQLHNESIMSELNKTKEQIGSIVRDAESQLDDIKKSATLETTPDMEEPDAGAADQVTQQTAASETTSDEQAAPEAPADPVTESGQQGEPASQAGEETLAGEETASGEQAELPDESQEKPEEDDRRKQSESGR